jgi:hypothetical protein
LDWNAIGAAAEVVSAVGVVASLIYLGLQIRDSNRESRIAANAEIAREYRGFLQFLSSDSSRQSLWMRAWGDADPNLSDEERNEILVLTGIYMRIVENAYLQFKAGRLEQRSWDPYLQITRRGAISPTLKWYIEMREDMHTADFIALLKSIMSAPAEQKIFY